MSFNRNLLFGLGFSLLLLLVSSAASFISIRNLIDSSAMVRDTNKNIRDLETIFSLVKDAETGQRGYLLSGDSRFLEPYTRAKGRIDEAITNLSVQLTQSVEQSHNMEKLRNSIDMRISRTVAGGQKIHGRNP